MTSRNADSQMFIIVKRRHIAPACRKKKNDKAGGSSGNTKHLAEANSNSNDEEYKLHTVASTAIKANNRYPRRETS